MSTMDSKYKDKELNYYNQFKLILIEIQNNAITTQNELERTKHSVHLNKNPSLSAKRFLVLKW